MKKIGMLMLVAGAAGVASAGTIYYSRGDERNGCTHGDLSTAVKWYTDPGCADAALADPQPVPTADDDNTYVFLTSMKFNSGPTFPKGTHVWFGLPDGSKAFVPNCNSDTWAIPDGTVYGWTFRPNWSYTGVIQGHYTFVKTRQEIAFGATALTDNQAEGKNPYGETLGDATSTFRGEADVLVNLYCMYGSGEGNGMCRVVVAGDFSAYRGRFATVAVTDRANGANLGFLDLRYTSATAFGDSRTPCADALTLRHRAQLSLTDAVVQSESRGITVDLPKGKYAAFRAEAGASWTLTAPVVGAAGLAGTLRKTGAGTVTYDGRMQQVPHLEATEGTLVLGEHSVFDEGTALTVRSGAHVVVRRAGGLAGFALTVEPGGLVSYEVPFDAASMTASTVDVSAVEAAALTYPLGVLLTQNIALPVNETTALCVLRFAADCARAFAPEDFALANAKSYQLPTTWFTVEKDAEGRTCVLLNVRAAIGQTGQRWGQASRPVSDGTEYTWSDHQEEHGGADYFSLMAYSSYNGGRTRDGSNIAGTFEFAGESFTLGGSATAEQNVNDYCERLYFRDLRLYRKSALVFNRASTSSGLSGGVRDRTLSGFGYVDAEAQLGGTEARVTINNAAADGQDLNLVDMAFSGSGTLQFYAYQRMAEETPHHVRIYGANTNFAGRFFFYSDAINRPMLFSATNGCNFGGAPAEPMTDAVRIAPISSVTDPKVVVVQADESLVADEPNRGWTVTTGTLRAPADVTFTLKSPLTVATRLVKDGAGTLALGCATTGEGKAFDVEEGWLMPLTSTCCAPLAVTLADGAGIALDALVEGEVRQTGLVAQSIALAGSLRATIRNWEDCGEAVVRRAILTVPATTENLKDRIELVGSHATKRVLAVTDETAGTTTYFAEFSAGGTTVLFR
ncbi:MAG: hypothetical protein PUE68_05835 [Kiritimatiellae bacterium]|nr:hypothetical protein [Kiritimatiellia bacterium]